jgi:hypothetical protein
MRAALFGAELLSRWYLILTKPFGESIAQSHLTRQGYEVYFPRHAAMSRFRGQWRERVVALFTRYIFLGLDASLRSLGPVRSSVGVSAIVCFGASYAVVPDQVVSDLRDRADLMSGLHQLTCLCVIIWTASSTAKWVSTEQVVVMLLKILGHEVPVHVSASSLMTA